VRRSKGKCHQPYLDGITVQLRKPSKKENFNQRPSRTFLILNYSKQHVAPKAKRGILTIEQFLVLKYRARGFTQLQTANSLGMTRANVSMIESRAKRKITNAKATIRAYESLFSKQSVIVPKGTRLQQIPSVVFGAADRQRIHLKGNLVDVIRMVKSLGPKFVREGVTLRAIKIQFGQSGTLSVTTNK